MRTLALVVIGGSVTLAAQALRGQAGIDQCRLTGYQIALDIGQLKTRYGTPRNCVAKVRERLTF